MYNKYTYHTNKCQLKLLVLEEKEQNACVQEKVANMHPVKHVSIAENHVIPEEPANKYLSNQFNPFNPSNQKYIVFKRNNTFVYLYIYLPLLLLLLRFLRPYLQCCLCENPFGCLQLILRLYFNDHLPPVCLCFFERLDDVLRL